MMFIMNWVMDFLKKYMNSMFLEFRARRFKVEAQK
jgi:hypothetical protein